MRQRSNPLTDIPLGLPGQAAIAGLWLAILAYTSATLLVIMNSLRLLAAPKQP